MIYLDVTAACLPLQSGIPRTTRGLWELLKGRDLPVTPIYWQPFRGCYTELSLRSKTLLRDPFALSSSRTPRDSTGPILRAAFRDLFSATRPIDLPRILRKEDILFLTSIFPDNRLGYLERLRSSPGKKMAIFHDAIPLRDPNVARWEQKRHLTTLRLLAGMDAVVAVSQSSHDDLTALWLKNFVTPGPTCVIPWPVPFTGPRPLPSWPRRDPLRLLCVSRLKQTKNHATLFAACELLWREDLAFELHLIGCADEARETKSILREMDRLRGKGRPVRWRGQVSEEELHCAYAEAIFTVFPSQAEGFGLPILESLWHARPVILGEQGAVGELVSGGGCAPVNVSRPESIASAMRELLTQPARLATLSHEAAERSFRTWDDYARDLLPLLETA